MLNLTQHSKDSEEPDSSLAKRENWSIVNKKRALTAPSPPAFHLLVGSAPPQRLTCKLTEVTAGQAGRGLRKGHSIHT